MYDRKSDIRFHPSCLPTQLPTSNTQHHHPTDIIMGYMVYVQYDLGAGVA